VGFVLKCPKVGALPTTLGALNNCNPQCCTEVHSPIPVTRHVVGFVFIDMIININHRCAKVGARQAIMDEISGSVTNASWDWKYYGPSRRA
jgi:hypothetical protein